MRRFAGRSGFTLVELMAVLALLGLIGLLAVPSLQGLMDYFLLEEAAWRLARDLRLAQQEAVAREHEVPVYFDVSGNRYLTGWLYDDRRLVDLPRGINLDWTNFQRHRVVFHPTGAPSRGGTVVLENRRGDRRYIMVTVGVGRVRVARER